MNYTSLLGNLGADPEIRFFDSGKCVVKFNIAVNKPRSKEGAGWFTVEAWNGTAQYIADYARKGSRVLVQGSLRQDSWVDKDGNRKYNVKVVADQVQILGGGRSDSQSDRNEAELVF